MNAGFLFQDRHWPSKELRESHDVIKTRSYIIHNEITMSDTFVKQYESVQTAFSYTDILTTKKLSDNGMFRKTRSQESLTKYRQQSSDDIMDWLHDMYCGYKPSLWTEKLKKLADKLKQPGGEEKLKKKIDRCVKKTTIPITAYSDNLPEQILKKIKRLCSINDKIRMPKRVKMISSIGSLNRTTLKRHIETWLKTLPIKKKDSFGRIIRREVISNSILYKLEPFIQTQSESILDYQNILRSHIMEIVYDIPIEHDYNKNGEYVKVVTDKIVNELINLNERKVSKVEVKNIPKLDERIVPKLEERNIDKRQPTEKDIKDFVTDEITYFLEGTNLTLSESSMIWIERELTDILMEALMHGFESDDSLKEDINMVLQDFGNFTEFQAEVFTRKLKKRLRTIFHIVRKTDAGLPTFYNYRKHCLVYYNSEDNNTAEKYFCANTKTYFEQLSKQTEEWLLKSNLDNRFKNEISKRFAIKHLVENIIKRHKYLERHPSRKRAEVDEDEYLTFQIRKWLRKYIGDKEDFTKIVSELTAILKAIPVPLLTTVQEIIQLSTRRNAELLEWNDIPNSKFAKEVYEVGYDWYQKLPNDLCYVDDKKSTKLFIRMLADNLERSIKENSHKEVNELIDKEVDYWVKRVLKCSPRIFLVEQLKYRISKVSNIKRDSNELPVMTNSIATFTVANNTNIDLESISDHTIYFKQVTREIDKWLTELLPDTEENVSKKFAIYDLATDIVDRQNYLKINPSSYLSEYEELETLKYQVFKWINKMIGEDKLETIKYASVLRDRIQSIPIPKQSSTETFHNDEVTYCKTKASDESTLKSNTEQGNIRNNFMNLNPFERTIIMDPSLEATEDRYRSDSSIIESNIQNYNSQTERKAKNYKITTILADCSIQCDDLNINNTSSKNSEITCQETSNGRSDSKVIKTKRDSLKFHDIEHIGDAIKKMKNNNKIPFNLSIYKVNVESKHKKIKPDLSVMDEEYTVPQGLSLTETYEYFETIFKNRCDELPFEATTPEQKQLVEIARQGIYNGIWKTFFKLKSDPNVENDYTLFEALLEDKLDAMLDVLPQTLEMQTFREPWKAKVIVDVTKLLDYVHSITEIHSLRAILANHFNKAFARAKNKELNDRLKHVFVTETVDAFILHSRYKNDELKSNIYRQRLMKKLEELCENIKTEYPFEFGNVNISQLCQEVFKILGKITLPEDEMLREEAEEILLGDEVEQWYTELPIKTNTTVLDDILRNRSKDLLIKKLYVLEKRSKCADKSAEDEMRREIDIFLERYAELDKEQQQECSCGPSNTKHSNLMTDVLMNRLKCRKQASYNCFQQGSYKSPKLVEPDPGSLMATLIDSRPQSRHSLPQQSLHIDHAAGTSGYTDQGVGPCMFIDKVTGPNVYLVQTPVAICADQQYTNVHQNQYLTVVSEEIEHPENVTIGQKISEAGTGTYTTAPKGSVNTRMTATNINLRQFENFEDVPCQCLEFYHQKRKRFYHGEGRHCINCGYSVF